MQESSFAEKFLKKINKIDSSQIESFLSQVLREKQFLEVILDSIPEGVIVVDQSGKVAYINDSARPFLGIMPRESPIGKSLIKLLKDQNLLDIAEEFSAEGVAIRGREVVFGNPVERVYTVSVVPIENADDVATHCVWILGDRTEVHRLIEEKQRSGNLESLATLTAGVAHEIKNPLNSLHIHGQLIKRNAQKLLKHEGGDDEISRIDGSTDVILEEIQRLARIVDTFTTAVRPVRPTLRKINLRDVIIPLLELVAPECEEKGIMLDFRHDPDLPSLLIDPEQIQQALLNILKNSIEAMDKPDGRISIVTKLRSDHAMIEVEDNGCGIAESDRLKVFQPHYTTKFTGTGLGLMMVYRIIKAHRGALALKSEVGVGTLLSIALPLDEKPIRMLPAEVQEAALEAVIEGVEKLESKG